MKSIVVYFNQQMGASNGIQNQICHSSYIFFRQKQEKSGKSGKSPQKGANTAKKGVYRHLVVTPKLQWTPNPWSTACIIETLYCHSSISLLETIINHIDRCRLDLGNSELQRNLNLRCL